MAEKEKKLSAEQMKELEVQLRAQLQRAEELKAYYEAHPDDPDAFAAFAKNAAATVGTIGVAGTAALLTGGTAAASLAAGGLMPFAGLAGIALGTSILGSHALTSRLRKQRSKGTQHVALDEAYSRVLENIRANGTDSFPQSRKSRAAFVEAGEIVSGHQKSAGNDAKYDEIMSELHRIAENQEAAATSQAAGFAHISNQIAELSAQLQPCRELASGILDSLPEGDEDSSLAERLYALTSSISAKVLEKQYGSERLPEAGAIRGELKQLFDPIWDRLDPRTQRELFSAKMSYQLLAQKGCGNDIDFSGVCTLASKAMEVECEKYFYKRFRQYIFEQTPEKRRDAQFVEALSLTPEAEKQSKQRGGFTLGSVQHILKPRYDREKGELEPYKRYMAVLTSYARERLFSPGVGADLMDDRQIQNILWKYVDYVNTVKNRYRNPSVHKELVSQQSALSCLDYVVDVEKKLKEMVSAFQN